MTREVAVSILLLRGQELPPACCTAVPQSTLESAFLSTAGSLTFYEFMEYTIDSFFSPTLTLLPCVWWSGMRADFLIIYVKGWAWPSVDTRVVYNVHPSRQANPIGESILPSESSRPPNFKKGLVPPDPDRITPRPQVCKYNQSNR